MSHNYYPLEFFSSLNCTMKFSMDVVFLKKCILIVDSHLQAHLLKVHRYWWSIPEIFWVWSNDWNFLWKHVKTISCKDHTPQYQPKWTHWSFKCGFAAFLVKVGYCGNLLTKCQLRISLMYTWSNFVVWGNLSLKIAKMRTIKPRKIINHCKLENCNDWKDN